MFDLVDYGLGKAMVLNQYIYIHIHFKWPLGYQQQTPSMLALNSLEELLGSCAKVSYYNHVGCDVI